MNLTYPLLSVLAAGISGSARLHERLGSAEASRAVDRCIKRIERSVDAFGGRIVQNGGDELLVVFDTADAAIHSAIEMQQRVGDLPPVSGVKMAIRVGISCGEPDQSSLSVDEDSATEAARLAGTAKSGQILTTGKIRELASPPVRALLTDTGSILPNNGGRNEPILDVAIPEPLTAHAVSASESTARKTEGADATAGCLRLRYGQDTILVNERKPLLRMGRDGGCDIVIHDRRASRHHASIERRGNSIVLIDRSTNGTYVTVSGLPEQFLKHSECTLQGKGLISFASPSSDPNADFADFEVI